MKSIGSMLRAFLLTIVVSSINGDGLTPDDHAHRSIAYSRSVCTRKFDVERTVQGFQYKSGVLIGDYVSVILIYLVLLGLRPSDRRSALRNARKTLNTAHCGCRCNALRNQISARKNERAGLSCFACGCEESEGGAADE